MWRFMNPRHREQRGLAMLVLLIVLVIICFIMFQGPLSVDPTTQVTQAQSQIDRSAAAACAANRAVLNTQITTYQISNPGASLDMEVLKRAMNIPKCPGKGEYLIGPKGEIYCTEHAPPPPEMLQKLVNANGGSATAAPTPAYTPFGAGSTAPAGQP